MFISQHSYYPIQRKPKIDLFLLLCSGVGNTFNVVIHFGHCNKSSGNVACVKFTIVVFHLNKLSGYPGFSCGSRKEKPLRTGVD